MADKKFSELTGLVGTPDDESLLALSENDGMGNFSSVKMSITQLKAIIGSASSGTYTPVATAVTNVSSTTAYECQYMQVGNVVNVSGRVDFTASIAGQTIIHISLPVNSAITQTYEAGGTCIGYVISASNNPLFTIQGGAGSNRVYIAGKVTHAGPCFYYFTFQYLVI